MALTWKKISRTNLTGITICSALIAYDLYLIFIGGSIESAAYNSFLVLPFLLVILTSGLIREEFEYNQIYPFLSRLRASYLFAGKVLVIVIIICSIYLVLAASAAIMILAGHESEATARVFSLFLRGFVLSFYFSSLGLLLATRLKGVANFALIFFAEFIVIIFAEEKFGILKMLEARKSQAFSLKNLAWLLILPIRDRLADWHLFSLFAVSIIFIFSAFYIFKQQSDKHNMKLINVDGTNNFLLQTTGLKKTYKEGLIRRKTKEALKGVDIQIKPGRITGFLGPNGAGKSTTIKIILNFLKPEAGKVEFSPPNHRSSRNKCPDIGYLPELAGLYPFLTPRECLYFMARNYGMNYEDAINETQKLAEKLTFSEHLDRRVKNLSKGTVQKVALAAAILGQPDLLVFDEPFTGLDPIIMHEIRNLILELKQSSQTIFLSSHLLPEVEKLCDEVILINEGQILYAGEIARLKTAWQVYELSRRDTRVAARIQEILGPERFALKFSSLQNYFEIILNDQTIAGYVNEMPSPDLEKIFLGCVMENKTETYK